MTKYLICYLVLAGAQQADMQAHAEWLLTVGNGSHTPIPGLAPDMIRIPDHMAAPTENITDLITTIFPSLQDSLHDIPYIRGRAILAPKNEIVTSINDQMMDSLPTQVCLLATPTCYVPCNQLIATSAMAASVISYSLK